MQILNLLILLLLIVNTSLVYAGNTVIASCDKIPIGYHGKIFRIKTDYPTKIDSTEKPWKYISFKEEPEKYAYTVLKYIYKGNIDCDFDLHCNKVGNWYHAHGCIME